jgi:uncharacterized membrane protein
MFLSRHVPVIVITFLLFTALAHSIQNASCTFHTFPAPAGYSFGAVQGVSDDGTVVGQLIDKNTQQFVAFSRSAGGVFTKYTAPKSQNTWLYGRNDSSVSVGTYQDSAYPGHLHGFLQQGGTFTELNYPKAADTWLYGINQLGAMAGSFRASASSIKGFTLANGKYTTIAYPKALATFVLGINDNGEAVGYYASDIVNYGYAWKNGTFTDIDYPNSKYGTVLFGVNKSGVIVGNHISADRAFGFIYANGAFKNIVYSGADYTVAGGINNNGLISGQIFLNASTSVGYTATCK